MANEVTAPVSPIWQGVGQLHQALHGYSGGHRLLATSIQLPDDISRLVLRISDLSGSGMQPGFEEYLTAYPLESIGMYALAKTWYAHEMPRPGCVWTHTLFLSEKELVAPSLSYLVKMFRRPQAKSSHEFYSNGIIFHAPEFASAADNSHLAFLGRLLEEVYVGKPVPVIVPAVNAGEYEAPLLAMWSQQWPSLRRRFSFCTGALSARKLGEDTFDVQCTPIPLVRDLQLELRDVRPKQEIRIYSEHLEPPIWSIAPAADCLMPVGGEFRKFLWQVAEESGGREQYLGLASIYEFLKEGRRLTDLITVIAEAFPVPTRGARLKKLILGSPNDRMLFERQDELTILTHLGTCNCGDAFDASDLRLRERGAALARNYDKARSLVGELFQRPLSPLGVEILAGLISDLESPAAREIAYEHSQFLSDLVSAKPALATSPGIWKAAGGRRWDLLESLIRRSELSSNVIQGTVYAFLEAGCDDLVRRAFDSWGKPAVVGALRRMEACEGWMGDACKQALTFHVGAIMEWLEDGTERSLSTLFALADVMAPFSYEVYRYDAGIWERPLRDALRRSDDPNALRFLTFILSLGLGGTTPNPLGLVGYTFSLVHQAAQDQILADDSWRILDPIVPRVLPHYWDRCERMRRGLVEAFIKHGWPSNELHDQILDSRLERKILASAKHVNGGKSFLKTIRR
jgi:hypothetical protein